MNDILLEAENLCKYWGGLRALDEFNIKFHDRSLHSIVGPNGAGKSTLLNILCGAYAPTKGVIIYDGNPISKIKPYEFSRLGIGRSFQKTNIYSSATCLENCCIAAQEYVGGSFDLFSYRESNDSVTSIAREALEKAGLEDCADRLASDISYGEQRQLEIAMVLSSKPKVLLLDEPMAGMGHEESMKLMQLLKELKKEYCIVLVEHDMDAVFELSDLMTVMVDGTHLVTGEVDEIRNNPLVQEAYLGDDQEEY